MKEDQTKGGRGDAVNHSAPAQDVDLITIMEGINSKWQSLEYKRMLGAMRNEWKSTKLRNVPSF